MKVYSSDFETTVPQDKTTPTRVWVYACCEIDNENIDNVIIGHSMEEFIEMCKRDKNSKHYYHNLKFDGEFIIWWLLANGYTHTEDMEDKRAMTFNTMISSSGQFYKIEIIFKSFRKRYEKVEIYDSMKKLPFTVKKIAKAFDLPFQKLEIDYTKDRPIGYIPTEHEIVYTKSDVIIIAMALKIQFNQDLTKMTIGSDALSSFKESIGVSNFNRGFPVLAIDVDADIRLAYRGGVVGCNPNYQNTVVGKGDVYDATSHYPSIMYNEKLPFGEPKFFTGEYRKDEKYPLYIQKIRAKFRVKENHIPTIQIKNNLAFVPTEYLKEYVTENEYDDGVTLYMTNIDMKLFIDHYDIIDIEYLSGWKFQQCVGIFKPYIDKWLHIKETHTGAMREIAKLMLNSLYGKFATNPDVTGKVPYMDDPNKVRYKRGKEEKRDPIYTAMGVFITSYGREITTRIAQSDYKNWLYFDTDSNHFLEGATPTGLDRGFGWKHEYSFKRARYIRAKTYADDTVDEGLVIRCAGMPQRIKDTMKFEDFKVGFSSYGKLIGRRREGGVVLEDTEFTIKDI